MKKVLPKSTVTFLFGILCLTFFSPASAQTIPSFTSSAPSGTVIYDRPFTYAFSATDGDSDPISFFVPGSQQNDAQYLSGYNTSTGSASVIWQSFTAVNTGLVVTAGAYMFYSSSGSGGTVTVSLYSGEGTGGALLYTSSIHMPNAPNYQLFTVPVSSNVMITSGQKYTIAYSGSGFSGLFQSSPLNPYADGRSSYSANVDLPFQVKIKPLITTPAATWLTLTDNGDGTGSLSGTPLAANAGAFSETLIVKAGSDYIQQAISFTIVEPVLPPTGLFAIAGDSQVELKWRKNASANFSKYYIYGGNSPNPTTLIDSSSSVSDTTRMFTDLTNGTFYYYRLKAKNTFGVISDYSGGDAVVPEDGEGNALSFDGDGDYVSIPNLSAMLSGKTALTISGWVYPRNPEGNPPDLDHFFGFRNDSDADFYVMQAHGTNLKAVIRTSSGAGEITSTGTLIPNEWQHVALTYDGAEIRLYHNGNDVGSSPASGTIGVGNLAFQMGYSNEGPFNYYLDGNVDEVQLWNKTQSQEEIVLNYTIPVRGDEPFLLGAWHLDEPSGAIAYDATPNGNNGTLVGGTAFTSSTSFFQATLPVELSSFTGEISGGKVVLNWSTASEENNAGWEIQIRNAEPEALEGSASELSNQDPSRTSGSRLEWETIGFVAGKGTTTEAQNYEFSSIVTRPSSPAVYRLKQLDLDGTVSFSQILTIENKPTEFSLQQNYPNPFNPVTVITYRLASKGNVELRVFDMLGREVKTLVNQVKEAGNYSVDFSAENLPSGLYLYRLNAGNFSETRKMTILK